MSDHIEKPRHVDLKAYFDSTTKIYFNKFLEKRALFMNNVLHGKSTRQKEALLKALLAKDKPILPKCEITESLATDFNKICYFKSWEYFCINSGI